MGHPILGDHQYGKSFRCPYQAPRCLLHALSLKFPHPIDNKPLVVHASIPEDFMKAIEQLFGHYEDINR